MKTEKYNISASSIFKRVINWFFLYSYKTFEVKPKFKDFLEGLASGLNYFNASLYSKFTEVNNYLSYTPQHLSLEKLLNDRYDNTLRRIYISENNTVGNITNDWYLDPENDNENKTWYLDPVNDFENKIWFLETVLNNEFNFTVFYPNSLTLNESEVYQLLKNYVIAGKEFDFDTF